MTTQILLQDLFSSAVSGYWGSGAGASEVDVKIVRNGDIARDGSVRWGELPVRGLSEAEAKKASILDGDLLITTSGECGRVALVRSDPVGVCTSNFVRRIRCDTTQTDPSFAYHLLRDRTIQKEFARFTRGTTLQNLSLKKAFSSISVAVPPLEEQRRIASILDAADTLRTKRQQAIDQLDTLSQAIFDSMFEDVVRVMTVEAVMENIIDYRGKSPRKTDHGVPLITARLVKNFELLDATEFIPEDDYESWMRRGLPRRGDVVFTTEAPMGEVALISEEAVALAQRLVLLRPKRSLMTEEFLMYVLRSRRVRQDIRRRATGSTVLGIRQKELRKVNLPIPPLTDQQTFSKRLRAISQVKNQVNLSATVLDALSASLKQRAFRGDL